MSKVCILKAFETLNIFQEKEVAGGSFERYMQFRGNSLLNTISIDRLDSGNVVFEFYEIIEANVENLIKTDTFNSTGLSQFILIPFHTQIKIKVTTTDIASFTLKSTCRNDVVTSELVASINAVPLFIDGEALTTPGAQQTLAASTVPAGKSHNLSKIHISGSLTGKWIADIDSAIIGSGRIASGSPNSTLEFTPNRKILAAETLTLRFTAKAGPVSSVSYHIMLSAL